LSWRRIVGILLVVIGCVGFGTIADDLRHTGELFGVGGILMIGVVFVVADSSHAVTRRLALNWLAAGVGMGILVGATMDRVPMCVAVGGALGALAWGIFLRRRQ
jgi:hypothetical protein